MSELVTRPRKDYPADALATLTPGFSLGNARACAWLAQLAYEEDTKKILSILNDWGLTLALRLAPAMVPLPFKPRTQGLVLRGHDRTIMTFAGTDPLDFADWLTDLNFIPGADGAHQGFTQALDAEWPAIETFLRSDPPPRSLWLVGHSLGAAIAALCAQRLHSRLNITADAIYTFGMPRIAGREFGEAYEPVLGARTFRMVHGQDIVPAVPPSPLGFRHVGRRLSCARLKIFDANGLASTFDDDPQFPAQMITAADMLIKQLLLGSVGRLIKDDPYGLAAALLPIVITDHLPDRYCRATTQAGR